MVDLWADRPRGSVYMNKYVYDCDIPILIGHVQGNPYGGYSGGYKHSATGITNWMSIASHHVPSVMHRKDFTPGKRRQPDAHQNLTRSPCTWRRRWVIPFFCCDAVLDTSSRQIAIYSGYAKEMMPESWKIADKRTYVTLGGKEV